jgi:glycosyltransferase involved in cell wall biosynthesis
MAGTVLELLDDELRREDLGHRARDRAQELSLPRAARRHAEIYAQVAALPRR